MSPDGEPQRQAHFLFICARVFRTTRNCRLRGEGFLSLEWEYTAYRRRGVCAHIVHTLRSTRKCMSFFTVKALRREHKGVRRLVQRSPVFFVAENLTFFLELIHSLQAWFQYIFSGLKHGICEFDVST